MILYFIRHGEAGATAPNDFERTLTVRGESDAIGAGRALKAIIPRVHRILASPLVRAQQTAALVQQFFPTVEIEPCDHLIPGADSRNLFTELQHSTNDSNLLLISHEPFISTCISTLTYGSSEARIVIRPASVACVQVGPILQRGAGRLEWLMNAELLSMLSPHH